MRRFRYTLAVLIAAFAFSANASAQVVQVSAEAKAAGQAIQLAPTRTEAVRLRSEQREASAETVATDRAAAPVQGVRKQAPKTNGALPWGQHEDAAAYEAAKLAWIETNSEAYRNMSENGAVAR